jgi:hypothetical protein
MYEMAEYYFNRIEQMSTILMGIYPESLIGQRCRNAQKTEGRYCQAIHICETFALWSTGRSLIACEHDAVVHQTNRLHANTTEESTTSRQVIHIQPSCKSIKLKVPCRSPGSCNWGHAFREEREANSDKLEGRADMGRATTGTYILGRMERLGNAYVPAAKEHTARGEDYRLNMFDRFAMDSLVELMSFIGMHVISINTLAIELPESCDMFTEAESPNASHSMMA